MNRILAYPVAALSALALATPTVAQTVRAAQPVPVKAQAKLPQRASAKAEDGSQIVGLGLLLAVVAVGGAVAAVTVAATTKADSGG